MLEEGRTSEEQQELTQFVGPRADWYLEKWNELDLKKSTLSWNWPAFFLGPIWVVYRKMYLYAVILTCVYFMFYVTWYSAFSNPSGVVTGVISATLLAAPLGLFANYIYRHHVEGKVAVIKARNKEVAEQIVQFGRQGHTGAFASIGFAMLFVIMLITAAVIASELSRTREQGAPITFKPPPQPGEAGYFTYDKFSNPVVLEAIYHTRPGNIASLPEKAKTLVAIYVMHSADQMEATCGEFLSPLSTFVRGTFRALVGIATIGGAINSVQQQEGKKADAFVKWLGGLSDMGTVSQQAKSDVATFLKDVGTCSDKRAAKLRVGLDKFFQN